MPSLPPPLWADLYLDGAWTPITGDVSTEAAVTVTRGRSGERNSAGPAQGNLPLINRGAKYSRRNPNSELFGDVGLNTPVRYGVTAGSPWLLMEGTTNTGSYVSTPSASSLNITGDLEVRMELAFDNPAIGQSLAGRFGASGSFSWRVGLSGNAYPFVLWSEDGTATKNAISTIPIPAMPGQRFALRIVLDVNNGASGNTTRFYMAKTIDAPDAYWQMLGTPVTNSGTTSVFDPTADLWAGAANVAGLTCFSGRLFRFQLYDAGSLISDLDTSTATVGASTLTDDEARVWTLNGACSLTNDQRLFQGEIPAWNPSRDKSGNERRMATAPAGILQRLDSGNQVLRSPLFREMTNPGRSGIVAYWPCEESSGSTVVSSGLGQAPMTISGTPTFANYSALPGSNPLPDMANATFTANVAAYTVTGETSLRMWAAVPSAGVSTQTSLCHLRTTGTAQTWELLLETDGDITIRATDSDGTVVLGTRIDFNIADAELASIVLEATQDGSDVDWRVVVENYTGLRSINDTVPAASGSGTLASYTFGRVTRIQVGRGAGLAGTAIGHVTLASDLAAYSTTSNAAVGWGGEGARARFNRLCREQNVAGAAALDMTYEPHMGAQKSAKFLELLREVETTDGGILAERPDGLGLAYRGASTMWGQQPALVIDWSAGLVDAITPKDDDKAAFNSITVKRIDGSEAIYTLESGVNSVEDIGLKDTSVNLSVDSDDVLPSQAHRRVQLATVDEMRYPLIVLNLANERVYAMLDDIYAVDIGDLIRLDDIPADYGAGSVDLIVIGIKDAEGPKEWTRGFVCVPGEPWTTRNASSAAALPVVYENFEDTTYTITITNGGTLPWLRSSAHFNTGAWSLRSGAISNNQTSVATVTVPAGAVSLTFWYRTSSEAAGPGFLGDRLTVTVDGAQVLLAQGETDWTPLTVDVTGKASVAFTYTKDNSSTSGEDAVYIDDVTFVLAAALDGEARADSGGCELAAGLDATQTDVDVTTTGVDPWVDFATYPTDFPFDITVGGEVMRVIYCTGTTTSQTLTVIRSINGVVKTQSTGEDVRLATPIYAP